MKKLFVDTAGWMAMADSKDPLDGPCRAARDQWLETGGILVVSNEVIDVRQAIIFSQPGSILLQFWLLKQRLIVIGFQRQNSEKGKLEQYTFFQRLNL